MDKNFNQKTNFQHTSRKLKTLLKSTKPVTQFVAAAAIGVASLVIAGKSNLGASFNDSDVENPKISAFAVVNPTVKYGFALDTFHVIEDKIKCDDIFTTMLMSRGLTYKQADSLGRVIKPNYNFEKIQDGKPFTVLTRDARTGYDYLIYEPDPKRYVVVDFKKVTIREVKREVSVR